MNRTEGRDGGGRKLTTADLAAAGRQPASEAIPGESPDARIERERIERERADTRVARERQNDGADERIEGERIARANERIERDQQNEQADDHAVHRFEMEQRAQRAEGDRQSDSVEQRRAEERDGTGARAPVRAGSPWMRPDGTPTREREKLEPLFPQDVAERYRSEWAAVQSSFVDDPKQAAARGDELVAQVMKGLAESFAHEREQLEQQLSRSGEASTETLRIGFRRYRSFFERLLAL
jgi:hypothetical protein